MSITIDGTGTIAGLSAGGLPDGAITMPDLNSSVSSGVAKAWVNFNGTGTVAIRGSFNVSSITDNGVGDYTANFTTAMANANFAAVTSSKSNDNTTVGRWYQTQACAYATTSVRLLTASPTSGSVTDAAPADAALVNLSVFR